MKRPATTRRMVTPTAEAPIINPHRARRVIGTPPDEILRARAGGPLPANYPILYRRLRLSKSGGSGLGRRPAPVCLTPRLPSAPSAAQSRLVYHYPSPERPGGSGYRRTVVA